MKKFRFNLLAACAVSLSLLTIPASAITPAQLTAPFFRHDVHLVFSIENVHDLLTSDPTPLGELLRFGRNNISDVSFRANLERIGAFNLRCSIDPQAAEVGEPLRKIVYAAEINGALDRSLLPIPNFSVDWSPKGTLIEPLLSTSENGTTFYFALLTRDDQQFLICADEIPALQAMAAAPETSERGVISSSVAVLGMFAPAEALQEKWRHLLTGGEKDFSETLRLEFALYATSDAIKLHFESNVSDVLRDSPLFNFWNGRAWKKPLLLGSEPLLAFVSLGKLDGLNRALEPEKMRELGEALRRIGLSLGDLDDILSDRITLAVSGASSTLIGSMPGFYIHLPGANRRTCDALMTLINTAAALESSIKLERFTSGGWTGLRTASWSIFNAYAAVGDGFVAAFQNSSELNRAPSVAPEIERNLSQESPFIVACDVNGLSDRLEKLVRGLGSLVINEEQKYQAEEAFKIMRAFRVFNMTMNATAGDIELFVNEPAFRELLGVPEIKANPFPLHALFGIKEFVFAAPDAAYTNATVEQ